jgi:hypothetical protein
MDPFSQGAPGFFGGQGEFPYPGLGNPAGMAGTPAWPTAYSPQLPAAAPTGLSSAAGAAAGTGGAAGGLGGLNLNQVKGFIDKMGGIDGIVGTMTRVQKVVTSFKQMAPMLKLLMGSFGAKAAAKSLDGDGLGGLGKRRRKRRRKSGGSKLKKYRSTKGKIWAPKGRKRR